MKARGSQADPEPEPVTWMGQEFSTLWWWNFLEIGREEPELIPPKGSRKFSGRSPQSIMKYAALKSFKENALCKFGVFVFLSVFPSRQVAILRRRRGSQRKPGTNRPACHQLRRQWMSVYTSLIWRLTTEVREIPDQKNLFQVQGWTKILLCPAERW